MIRSNSRKQLRCLTRLNTPLRRAVKFGAVASASTVLCVALEGRLWDAEPGVEPFIWNFSTLLDFLVLDPLVILFLGLSLRSMRPLGINTPSHGLAALAAGLGFGTMTLYYGSFGTGVFRDAVVLGPGFEGVTRAGWVVFWWTALALSYIYFAVIAQVRYLLRISRVRLTDVRYEPLHADECGGFLRLSKPAWWFLNAMLMGLLIFVGFYLQDKYLNTSFLALQPPEIRVSGRPPGFRLYAFWVYLIIVASFFVPPVLHLRRLMQQARDRMLAPLKGRFDLLEENLLRPDGISTKDLKDNLTALVELRKQVSGFPDWPLPAQQLLRSAVLGPFVASLPKLVEVLSKLIERVLEWSGLR